MITPPPLMRHYNTRTPGVRAAHGQPQPDHSSCTHSYVVIWTNSLSQVCDAEKLCQLVQQTPLSLFGRQRRPCSARITRHEAGQDIFTIFGAAAVTNNTGRAGERLGEATEASHNPEGRAELHHGLGVVPISGGINPRLLGGRQFGIKGNGPHGRARHRDYDLTAGIGSTSRLDLNGPVGMLDN